MLADQEEDEDPVPVRLNADREEAGTCLRDRGGGSSRRSYKREEGKDLVPAPVELKIMGVEKEKD